VYLVFGLPIKTANTNHKTRKI